MSPVCHSTLNRDDPVKMTTPRPIAGTAALEKSDSDHLSTGGPETAKREDVATPFSPEDEARLTKRVLLKMDTRILPILSLLFLCSFLDRTNVGNAKIIGLEKDLAISNTQYNRGLAVFYATYIASELPSNLLLKKITPRVWLPLLTVVWGIVTMCLGFVRSFGSFFAVRAVLGLAEGGLLPGMVLYLSGLYTRQEMAVRIGVFYTAASLSGAFGGELLFPAGRKEVEGMRLTENQVSWQGVYPRSGLGVGLRGGGGSSSWRGSL